MIAGESVAGMTNMRETWENRMSIAVSRKPSKVVLLWLHIDLYYHQSHNADPGAIV